MGALDRVIAASLPLVPKPLVRVFAKPYVAGESLRHRIDREKQLTVDEALHIATAIAGALDYAHRHGIIHRDLKPENILLHESQPLVTDFGIALAVSKAGGARVTQTGLVVASAVNPAHRNDRLTISGRDRKRPCRRADNPAQLTCQRRQRAQG